MQIGWPTRLVSFGPDVIATVFAMGFATRAAMSFGGIEPGDFRKILIYNKDRVFAFALPMGYVTDEWYANAAGAINWGFPVIADTPIPEVLPTGICTYEHVVSNIPHDKMVAKAVEVRGLKVNVAEVPIPVAFGAAFEGERVRGEDIYLECGGGRTQMVEWVTSKRMDEVEDGQVEVIGPELTDIKPGSRLAHGHHCRSRRTRNAGRLRTDSGTPDPPSHQLRPGRHAHRTDEISPGFASASRRSKKASRSSTSAPFFMPNCIRTSAASSIRCR